MSWLLHNNSTTVNRAAVVRSISKTWAVWIVMTAHSSITLFHPTAGCVCVLSTHTHTHTHTHTDCQLHVLSLNAHGRHCLAQTLLPAWCKHPTYSSVEISASFCGKTADLVNIWWKEVCFIYHVWIWTFLSCPSGWTFVFGSQNTGNNNIKNRQTVSKTDT